MNYMVTN